ADHPLYAWGQRATGPAIADASGSGAPGSEDSTRGLISGGKPRVESSEPGAAAARLRATLRDQLSKATQAALSSELFDDFHRPTYAGWYVTGDAFGAGPARAGDFILSAEPDRPISRLVMPSAHSGLLASRLQGELHSRTFTI